MGKKILVAYFSHTGNTRAMANQIQKIIGADIFEIQPEKPYPSIYDVATKQAKQELESGFRPKLKAKPGNIGHTVSFYWYPVWWGTFPRPVFTFLSEYNFSGKKIVPFCTHEGSYLGQSVEDIVRLCPKSTILEGLAIGGRDLKTSSDAVTEWLRKLGMIG